ncbi:septation ring formation regulator EzrA [Fructobacillus ficulneus]|uniref:Septation ring formation regulator EzrA n=1 Tax=Fructobacillus ficulneus TaxID=157463 RepID=A0A0K8MFY1_9LACO|nr:septation ring formation regulator EzrA [Fructobacillus ficulneus]GAO99397.1 septation ring formation regulator EzrA [Fructobacillus ficulneus]
MWIILTVIVIVALGIGFTWAVFAQRKAASQVSDFALAKKALTDTDAEKDLAKARKTALTGEALKEYQELEKVYKDLRNHRFLEIDQEISHAMNLAAGLNVWKTRKVLQDLFDLMTEASELQKEVLSGLAKLDRQSQMQHQAVDQLHQEYPAIREKIAADDGVYGPAGPALLDFLEEVEESYQEYQDLAEKSERVQAAEKFEELGMLTGQVLDFMQNIPIFVASFNFKYLDQINELLTSWQELADRGVIFKTAEVQAALDDIDSDRLQGLAAVAKLKLKETDSISKKLGEKIQALYDLLEKEYKAYRAYFGQQDLVNQRFDRVKEQNHSLLIELTYLKGRFALVHDEEEQNAGYHIEIDNLMASQQEIQKQLKDHDLLYSQAVEIQENWLTTLAQLDDDQVTLFKQIEEFQPALESAKKHTIDYIDQIRGLKRSLERRDLPGLPATFLTNFFSVSDEIKRLDETVYTSEADLDEIQRQLNIVAADFDTLREEAQEVLIQADLAVALLQYANRYRETSSEVAMALEAGQALYQNDFDYAGVVATLKPALVAVEPGAYERLLASQDAVEL